VSDEDLRQAERRWRATGTAEDEAAYLSERVRAGRLSERLLARAAGIGHPAARIARGLVPLPDLVEPVTDECRRFLHRLAETFAWCETRVEDEREYAFRSPALAVPRGWHGVRAAAVEDVAKRRAAILAAEGWPMGVQARTLQRGRLLMFEPTATLSDGAASVVSNGFFDDDNVPAWDTWVHFVGARSASFLVCWIPEWFLETADGGIQVNPERCIVWAQDRLSDPFLEELGRIGLR